MILFECCITLRENWNDYIDIPLWNRVIFIAILPWVLIMFLISFALPAILHKFTGYPTVEPDYDPETIEKQKELSTPLLTPSTIDTESTIASTEWGSIKRLK